MVLSECYGCAKYALVCVNLIVLAVGTAIAVLSIWMLTDQTFMVSIANEEQNFNSGLYILLAAGILMLVIVFLGCCGAFRESRCMLVGFFCCLLVLIIAEIAAGVWLYMKSDRFEDLVKTSVLHSVKEEYGEMKARTQIVDSFQSDLKCCGASGPSDWASSKYSKTLLTVGVSEITEYKVPQSCCVQKDTQACKDSLQMKLGGYINPAIYNEGCANKLMDVLKSHSSIVLGVAIGVAILELLGLIFSLVLCCGINSSDRYKS